MVAFFPNNQWALPASSSVTPTNLQWACQLNGPPDVLEDANNTIMGSDGTITLPATSYYDVVLNYNQTEFGYTNTSPGSYNMTYYAPGSTTGFLFMTCPITGTAGSVASVWNRLFFQQNGTIKISINMPVAYTANFVNPCNANYVSIHAVSSMESIMSRQYGAAGSVPQRIRNAMELHTWATITSGYKVTFPLTVDGTTNGRALFSSIIPPNITAILTNAATSPINVPNISIDPYSATNPQSITVSASVGTTLSTVLVSAGAATQVAPPSGQITIKLHVIGFPY